MFPYLTEILLFGAAWSIVGFILARAWALANAERIWADEVSDLEYILLLIIAGPATWVFATTVEDYDDDEY
jgi:hypothetical protein